MSQDHFEDVRNYVNIALTGHYPLFFNEWIAQSFSEESINYRQANKNVRLIFKKMQRHKSTSRKKEFLSCLKEDERETFIQSFFKVVEYNHLQKYKELH